MILFLDHAAENATGTPKTPANWQHAMRSHAALTFEVVLIYSNVTVRVTQPEHWFLLPWLQYRSVKLIKRGHTSLFTTLIHVNRLVLTALKLTCWQYVRDCHELNACTCTQIIVTRKADEIRLWSLKQMIFFRQESSGRLDVNGKPFLIRSVWYRAAANIRALLVGNFNHLVRTTQVLLLWKT